MVSEPKTYCGSHLHGWLRPAYESGYLVPGMAEKPGREESSSRRPSHSEAACCANNPVILSERTRPVQPALGFCAPRFCCAAKPQVLQPQQWLHPLSTLLLSSIPCV